MRLLPLICFLLSSLSSSSQDLIAKVRALEAKVNDHYRRGEFERSLYYVDSILKLAPANLNYLTLGYETSLAELKDTSRAVGYLKLIVDKHPYEGDYIDQYGWVMLKAKNIPKALEYTTRAYNLERDNLPGLLNYAHALFLSGHKDDADRIYKEAEQITFSKNMFLRNQQTDFIILQDIYPKAEFQQLSGRLTTSFETGFLSYEKANALALIADSLTDYSGTVDQLVEYYTKAIEAELAVTPLRPKMLSRYYGFLANHFLQDRKYDVAISYFVTAMQYDEQAGNLPTMARRYQTLADIYKVSGKIDSANFYYSAALRYNRQLNNPAEIARVLFKLALQEPDQFNMQFVRDSIQMVLEKYNLQDDLADIYQYMAGRVVNSPDSQRLYLEKAVNTVLLNSLSEKALIEAYGKLGWIAINAGDLKAAEDYLLRAAAQITVSDKKSMKGFTCRWHLGELYYRKGEWERSKEVLNESVDILFAIRKDLERKTRTGIVSANPNVFTTLAEVYQKLQDPEGASKVTELSRSFSAFD